jgi:hypothetical protein
MTGIAAHSPISSVLRAVLGTTIARASITVLNPIRSTQVAIVGSAMRSPPPVNVSSMTSDQVTSSTCRKRPLRRPRRVTSHDARARRPSARWNGPPSFKGSYALPYMSWGSTTNAIAKAPHVPPASRNMLNAAREMRDW